MHAPLRHSHLAEAKNGPYLLVNGAHYFLLQIQTIVAFRCYGGEGIGWQQLLSENRYWPVGVIFAAFSSPPCRPHSKGLYRHLRTPQASVTIEWSGEFFCCLTIRPWVPQRSVPPWKRVTHHLYTMRKIFFVARFALDVHADWQVVIMSVVLTNLPSNSFDQSRAHILVPVKLFLHKPAALRCPFDSWPECQSRNFKMFHL